MIALWRRERSQFLATRQQILQRVVLDARGKLVRHLSGHERVGDLVLLEIVVQGNKVQTQFLGHDMHAGAAGKCRVKVHRAGVEAVAGISRHLVLRLQAEAAVVPVAEGHHVAVYQLTALGNACRARCVEQDEQAVRLRLCCRLLGGCEPDDVLRQEHVALIFIDHRPQFLVGNEQPGAGVLHHEVQPLGGIAGVKRLIGTASLQHAQRGDGHPF